MNSSLLSLGYLYHTFFVKNTTLWVFTIQRSMYRLGIAQYASEHFDEAKISFQHALNGYSILFGANHYIIAEILNNLGCALFGSNDLEIASDLFQKSFSIQTDLLRHDLYGDYEEYNKEKNTRLLNIATTGANMGLISLILGETSEAISLLESALLVSNDTVTQFVLYA